MGDVLRADSDDRAVERHDSDELLLKIGRPRWQVEQQDVERPPIHLMDELPQRRGQKGRAERQSLPLAQEKSDRHDPDPVRLERFVAHVTTAPEVPPAGVLMARQVDHEGDVGPIDVGIQETDRQAASRERKGEVKGDR